MELVKCNKCNNDFPKKRLELGYKYCVNCSTEKPLVCVTTVEGTGDHTYNDIIIMDQDTAFQLASKEAEYFGRKYDAVGIDYNTESSGSVEDFLKPITNHYDFLPEEIVDYSQLENPEE